MGHLYVQKGGTLAGHTAQETWHSFGAEKRNRTNPQKRSSHTFVKVIY